MNNIEADIQVVLDNTVLSSSHEMVQVQAALVHLDQLSSLRSTNQTNRAAHSIGDLEPPLEILELFVCLNSEDAMIVALCPYFISSRFKS
jgi:HJR/Mrr/RecB family endonuclease